MNKNESKYFKSAEKMQNALISLIEKKDFELITVKEICATAEVNRSTFYLHYDNTSDLLKEAIEAVYKDFFQHFSVDSSKEIHIGEKTDEELFLVTPEYLMPYLDFVEENRKLFIIMYEKNEMMGAEKTYDKWFRDIFRPILKRFGVSEEEQPFIMIFYLKGIIGVINEWLAQDCAQSKTDIIRIIQKCIYMPSNENRK